MSKKLSFFATACAAAVAVEAGVANAQVLEEVIVTAQRRTERLEDVPISISAYSANRLEKANITSFQEIGEITPGTVISQVGPFYLPAIRGVTSQSITSGQENNVATYIDGIYQPNKVGLNFDLIGIKDIEILKGPQGTLFGRNATGGAILINTLNPGDELEGKLAASYGRYDDTRVQGYVNVPLNDDFAFNTSAYWRASDGYYEDISGFDTAPHDETNIRTKLKYEPNDRFSAILGYNYMEVKDPVGIAWAYPNNPGAPIIADVAGYPGPVPVASGEGYKTSFSFEPKVDTESNNGTLTLNYDFGPALFKSLSSYAKIDQHFLLDVDGSTAPLVRQDTDHENKTGSQEFNLSSTGDDRLSWVSGLYFFYNKYDLNKNQVNYEMPYYRNSLKAEAWAAYLDGTYALTDQLYLTLGARYSSEQVKAEFAHLTNTPAKTQNESWDDVTPRVVLRYEFSPGTNVYASWTQGFKSGTFDSSTLVDAGEDNVAEVDPEEIDAYEIGFKTMQGNFRIDAATYYYKLKHLQDSRTVFNSELGGLATAIGNVGKTENYGVELQGTYSWDNLTVYGGAAWSHIRYTNYPDATNFVLTPTPVGSLWLGLPGDFDNLEVPRSPEWSANAGFDYTYEAGDAGSFDLSGNLSYTGDQNPSTSSYNPATGGYTFREDAYTLINLSLTWNLPSDNLHLTLYGKNITDEEYRIVYNAFNQFGQWQIFGEPLTYGVRAQYDF